MAGLYCSKYMMISPKLTLFLMILLETRLSELRKIFQLQLWWKQQYCSIDYWSAIESVRYLYPVDVTGWLSIKRFSTVVCAIYVKEDFKQKLEWCHYQ